MSQLRFSGWPPEAFEWFDQLEANNNREWFHEHRATYDSDVRSPLESLLAEVVDEFGEGVVSRPNRDTRFSKDKTPYRLDIYARITRESGGGYYVRLHPDGMFVGGGIYRPDRDRLARLRAAIADDRTGPQLERIVERLQGAGADLMRQDRLKSAPRGYAVDHPRIDLLRLRNLAGGTEFPIRKWIHTREAAERIIAGWRAVTPLMEWAASNC